MNKFENVDVFTCLDAIMRQNTGFFQSDFEIDKKIIAKAAASPNVEDKTLLWLSRPSGTHCFRERDVFLKDTAPHNTRRFHKGQTRDRKRRCSVCGAAFASTSNSVKYCPHCRKRITRRQAAGRMRKRRAPVTQ